MRFSRSLFLLPLAVVAALSLTPALGAGETEETYNGIAVNVNNAGRGSSNTRMTLKVRGWTSEDQRQALLGVLAEKGSDAMIDALRKEPKVGRVSFTGTLGYDLYYARAYQEGETRHLVFATERPISFVEVRQDSSAIGAGATIVHLMIGADGKGSGEILVGAELALDTAKQELKLERLRMEPVKLDQVTKQ
jgi:hypothetical protein